MFLKLLVTVTYYIMCEQVGQAGHGEPEYFEEAEGESRNFQAAWRKD